MTVNNVPNHEDFLSVGSDYLQLAWGQVADLLTPLDDMQSIYREDPEVIADIEPDYWKASRRILLTALTIVQQGIELALKGYIAEVSPYLLIQNPPGRLSETEMQFSDFKTIDAQDLIRMVSAFTSRSLSDTFKKRFEKLRRLRNSIMHSVDDTIATSPRELIEIVLEVHHELFPNNHWPAEREAFLDRTPSAHLGGNEFTRNTLCWELEIVLGLLKPAEVEKYFSIDKKQRRYYCPDCLDKATSDWDFEHHLAVLFPKSAQATDLYCFVCDETFTVTRESCDGQDCEGNVISADGLCLTCNR